MCGLAGHARIGGGTTDAATVDALVGAMMGAIAHRGPDGPGVSRLPGPVRLGFQRLSLVDLETGSQPLVSDDESLVLIANGEIYNHRELTATLRAGTRLRTRSDCEVLLYLYRERGLRFLDDVHGMFSLVLWDRRADTLIMARDRFGIKPLFWHRNVDRIVFSSEIKALFEDPSTPRRLDWAGALSDQLVNAAQRFSVAPLTSWFEDINLVPTATIVTFDLRTGTDSAYRYWEFPTYAPDETMTRTDFVREYGDRLRTSVHDCEMADVEIGLFLSGGVDSASIAALAETGPQTFSALNASTVANGDAEYSARIAASLGLANHQVLFDARAVPSPAAWLRFLWLLETPLAGPEAFYKHELYRYVRSATPHIKAMLLGGGADEYNGGYTTQFTDEGWPEFAEALQSMQLNTALADRPELASWWQGDRALVRTRVLRQLADELDPYESFLRWKHRDVAQYNCWHEDRTAAGNGIEARVPFLDHRLIELGAAIPRRLRPELLWNKQILREAVTGMLAPEFTARPKIPFFYGSGVQHTYRAFGRMLLAQDGELLQRALSGPGAQAYLDADGLWDLARASVERPTPGDLELLLRLVNLGLLEQMVTDLPAHHHTTGGAAAPERVVIESWTPALQASLRERTAPVVSVDLDAVPALDESVLLLHGDADTEWFIVVDGQIEYVVDELKDAAWLAFLRGIDGVRNVAELTGGVDAARELEPLIVEAFEAGLLAAAPVVEHELQRS